MVKLTNPGVPDLYQGTELWDLNLVDPDNRRPVEFEKRSAFLREIRKRTHGDILKLFNELLRTKEDGRIKLFLIWRVLQARNELLEVFQKGSYIPLELVGKFKDHIVAFARRHREKWAVTIAPRFLTTLVNEGEYPLGRAIWDDTQLSLPGDAGQNWRDVITDQPAKGDGHLIIGEVLRYFPTALLVNTEDI